MARLVWTARLTGKVVAAHATTHTALMQIAMPTHQKGVVRFRVFSRGASGNTPIRLTARRACSGTGATLAAITTTATGGAQIAKVNGQDAETIQGIAYQYTVQPTTVDETNGTPAEHFDLTPPLETASRTYVVNGGETLTLWGITATDAATIDIIAEIEE